MPNIYPCTPVQDLAEQALTKEQEELVGKGCAGPPVTLDSAPLTNAQVSYVCLLTHWDIVETDHTASAHLGCTPSIRAIPCRCVFCSVSFCGRVPYSHLHLSVHDADVYADLLCFKSNLIPFHWGQKEAMKNGLDGHHLRMLKAEVRSPVRVLRVKIL